MRSRLPIVLALSLGLNLLLAVAAYWGWRHARDASQLDTPSAEPGPAAQQVQPQVVVRRQFMDWSELESTNYATYIGNLRAIGCPEATICDIIVADVNQIYTGKRAAESARIDMSWWRADASQLAAQALLEVSQRLDAERRDLLESLLGPGWEQCGSDTADPARVRLAGPVLGQLPPETRRAVEEIAARAALRMQKHLAQGENQPGDPVELAHLRQQTRAELGRVLTPAQLEEYLLRYSETAAGLRSLLGSSGLSVTAEEFRHLFRSRDTLDQQPGGGADLKRRELESSWDLSLKQTLGAERYLQYQLAQDPVYRTTRAGLADLGAPVSVLPPVYEVNRLAAATRQRIESDRTLTAQERELAIRHVEEERAKSVQRILERNLEASAAGAASGEPELPPLPWLQLAP